MQCCTVSSTCPDYTLVSIFSLYCEVFIYTRATPEHWTTILSPPGVSYFKDCPQQPNIPNYLLGLVLISLLTHPLFTTAFGRRSRHPPQPPSCFKSCLKCLLSLVGITWLLAGMETFSKKDTAKLFDFEETKYNVQQPFCLLLSLLSLWCEMGHHSRVTTNILQMKNGIHGTVQNVTIFDNIIISCH